MKLKDKLAVVVGASGGVGSTLVAKLDEEGTKCVLVARQKEKLEKLIKSLSGKDHEYYTCDLADTDDVKRVFGKIAKKHKRIDLLFNAAGVGIYKGIEDLSLGEWNTTLLINLYAPFLVTKTLMPSLERSEESLVVSMGSGLGKKPYYSKRIGYIVSKFGLRGLSLALSRDHRKKRPKFMLMTMGSILTSFGPGGLEKRLKLKEKGKMYLDPEWVVKKILNIIKEDKVEDEVTLYPSHYIDELKKTKPRK